MKTTLGKLQNEMIKMKHDKDEAITPVNKKPTEVIIDKTSTPEKQFTTETSKD